MIKVCIQQNRIGHLRIYPVSQKVANRISKSNSYNGSSDVYLQSEYDINACLDSLKPSQRSDIENGYTIVHSIDEWTFRHMVGGQSD